MKEYIENGPCDECYHTNWTRYENDTTNCKCLCHVPAIVTEEDMKDSFIEVPEEFHDFYSKMMAEVHKNVLR